MSGCTCHHPSVWEYGPCDYCTSEICDTCEQHQDYCDCGACRFCDEQQEDCRHNQLCGEAYCDIDDAHFHIEGETQNGTI